MEGPKPKILEATQEVTKALYEGRLVPHVTVSTGKLVILRYSVWEVLHLPGPSETEVSPMLKKLTGASSVPLDTNSLTT